MNVVIADDHQLVREGMAQLLGDDVDIVGQASNGLELLEILATREVDVVLLDVRMPEMDGLEALGHIADAYPNVRTIVISMHDDAPYIRRAIELGASGYLLKSSGRDEVLRAIGVVGAGGTYIQPDLASHVLRDLTLDPLGGPPATLSPREREVLQLVASGLENKQIARELGISDATVKTYLSGVFEKLDVRSRAEAVAVGFRYGIVE